MALRQLEEDSSRPLPPCTGSNSRNALGPISQTDVLGSLRETELAEDPGFPIYEDEGNLEEADVGPTLDESREGFRESRISNRVRSSEGASLGFQIFEDPMNNDSTAAGSHSQSSSPAFEVFQDFESGQNESTFGKNGAQQGLTSAEDRLRRCQRNGEVHAEHRDSFASPDVILKSKLMEQRAADVLESSQFGDISQIARDEDTMESPKPATRGVWRDSIGYSKRHRSNLETAIKRLKQRSKCFLPPDGKCLSGLLSSRGVIWDFQNGTLPKALKAKEISKTASIKIGHGTCIIQQELGRGGHGVVVLVEGDSTTAGGVVAVKAQSPSVCLAWEYEILEHVSDRVGFYSNEDPFPFPTPYSFVSLVDGTLFSMSSGSKSGLNLIDLSNVYKVSLGEQVPEIIALHYTARMLNHLELLHWKAKILHCDVKPDNWVLIPSCVGSDDEIQGSELMLVDFGRAIDLLSVRNDDSTDALDVTLTGEATRKDMMCVAMRKGLPWSFDIDTFGLCAASHVLLFGTHMEIELKRNKRWMPKESIRRYHQKKIWCDLFDTLLNLEGGHAAIGSRPGSLRMMRKKIEAYLKSDRRRTELEAALKHQATILPKIRPSK